MNVYRKCVFILGVITVLTKKTHKTYYTHTTPLVKGTFIKRVDRYDANWTLRVQGRGFQLVVRSPKVVHGVTPRLLLIALVVPGSKLVKRLVEITFLFLDVTWVSYY